jgi:hypothetical protein
MKYIIYPLDNNTIGVLEPSLEISIEEAAEKGVPAGKPYGIIEDNEIDLQFVGLYDYKDGKAVLDISKAKQVHIDKFRSARTPILAALDIEYLKADEQDNKELKKEIAAKKQALRDVTSIELPNTLEEIKSVWPEILN